jgi:hypothetical protein
MRRRYICCICVVGILLVNIWVVYVYAVWMVYVRYICGWYMSRRHIDGDRCGRFMIDTYVGGIFVCGRNVGYVWVVYDWFIHVWHMCRHINVELVWAVYD